MLFSIDSWSPFDFSVRASYMLVKRGADLLLPISRRCTHSLESAFGPRLHMPSASTALGDQKSNSTVTASYIPQSSRGCRCTSAAYTLSTVVNCSYTHFSQSPVRFERVGSVASNKSRNSRLYLIWATPLLSVLFQTKLNPNCYSDATITDQS